jgi:hypothetical protein
MLNLQYERITIRALRTNAASPIGLLYIRCPNVLFWPSRARTLLSQLQDRYNREDEGDLLIFQQDLLLEEVAEPFRFGFNPFADRGCG